MIKSEDHDFMHVGSATSNVRLLSRSPHNNNTYHGEQLLIHQQKRGDVGGTRPTCIIRPPFKGGGSHTTHIDTHTSLPTTTAMTAR